MFGLQNGPSISYDQSATPLYGYCRFDLACLSQA
jgi:hypothetical protein